MAATWSTKDGRWHLINNCGGGTVTPPEVLPESIRGKRTHWAYTPNALPVAFVGHADSLEGARKALQEVADLYARIVEIQAA